ncbi:MAG TPA: DPP IV N-terminal domain-containing protein [Gemmatimonadales bacterium]|nr:DPP IV N-terminal domain-containing protein [Gemmatimonadales bacterium]
MRPSVLVLALLPALLTAQQPYAPPSLTSDDYARAERFLGYNVNPLVYNGAVRGTWLSADRLWFRNQSALGFEYLVADPARKSLKPAFDQAAIAKALSAAADTTYDAFHLPFMDFTYGEDGKSISFDAGRNHWTCTPAPATCTGERRQREAASRNEVVSPDGRRAAFIKSDNLWVKDVATGKETQLTTDGAPDFGYATDNAGWTKSDRPILVWSPDSRKIATFQQDQRGVGDMYLVQTRVGHPVLEAWKYPLPGDTVVTMIQRVIIDVDQGKVIRLQMAPDQHRSTLCDHIACGQSWTDVSWSPDGGKLFFVSTSRDHKHEWVRVADAATGAVREVFDESVPTQYESGFRGSNIRVLWGTNEFIWFSERDNWGHLYLYDLGTGKLKNRITQGEWPVLDIVRLDEATRTVWFETAGHEPANPYYRQLWSVRLDGSRLTNLTPEAGDHDVTFSPDGKYFVDVYSQPDVPPVSVLRDNTGRIQVPLEKADISKLLATGWKPPMVISVKARDGKTDLYGLLFRPTALDTTRKYPIVNNIYPGPQIGSVGGWGFNAGRGDAQGMAELGFVVVQINSMGTPMRSKAFHDAYYGDMGDNGLPDQIAGEKELAKRFSWIDLDRSGIWGHSGGGFASTDGILRYPDFFKVAVSEAGNHDNREYEDDWGERYQGLETWSGGKSNYDDQANQNMAKNLKGKLLIAYGTTDNNVPPYNSLNLINALIDANKDFDELSLPNRRHGFGNEPYMIRRRWDYFVKNLLGASPPAEYQMHPPAAPGFRRAVAGGAEAGQLTQ